MKGRKLSKGFLAVLVAVALAGPAAVAAKKIQYRMKFKKGEKLYLRVITDQKITQTVFGQEQSMEQTIGTAVKFDVNDVDKKGNALVDYTYDWVSLKRKGLMGEVVYDSNKKEPNVPPAARMYFALLGEGFSMRITPNGRVREIKGLKEMRENVEKKVPQAPGPEQMAKGLDQLIGEEAIREFVESLLAIYPDKPVGVGDSWSRKVLLSQEYPMVAEHEWRLKKRSKGVAVLENRSTFKPSPDAKSKEIGYSKTNFKLSGKQEGVIRIKESTGQLIDGKSSRELSGQMEMEIGVEGKNSRTFTMPMKVQHTMVIEMTKPKRKK